MGKPSRDKGARRERQVVQMHKDIGIKAARVPLSGAAGGRFRADVDVYAFGEENAPMACEVKARADASGWTTLKAWLSDNDALFLIEDRQEPLVVLPWRRWREVLEVLEKRAAGVMR